MPEYAPRTADLPSRPWWRDAVCYEIYVRSFADGDGDGVGDLPGIRARLPYLRALGVDAVWLTPFYPSPMADGGYDVADYRDVDPRFGTLADADALIATAHDLGLRVIIDLVPNHTSSAHPWFRAALAAPAGSPERDRYVFRPGSGRGGALPPNDWQSVFGGPAWTRVTGPDGQPGEWYLHLFAAEQPDLNWSNPEVTAEFEAVLRFWLDRGVDGVRIDVAHGLVKDPALPDAGPGQHTDRQRHDELPYHDQEGVHEIYRSWREVFDSYGSAPARMAVGEAWVFAPDRLARYVRPDELHQVFNFDFLTTDWSAVALRHAIDRSLVATAAVGASATWVLGNHDVVRQVTRFGGGPVGLRRARAAALLMLALPGAAYLYQGEELGLPEIADLPEEALADPIWERSGHTRRGRDGCRVPIPWAGSTPPFGFGLNGSVASWLPIPAAWRTLSVRAQQDDPGSTLTLYRAALRLRRELVESGLLGDGTLRWLDSPAGTLAFASRSARFVCTVNTGSRPVELPRHGELLLASVPAGTLVTPAGGGVVLPADTTAWWRAMPGDGA